MATAKKNSEMWINVLIGGGVLAVLYIGYKWLSAPRTISAAGNGGYGGGYGGYGVQPAPFVPQQQSSNPLANLLNSLFGKGQQGNTPSAAYGSIPPLSSAGSSVLWSSPFGSAVQQSELDAWSNLTDNGADYSVTGDTTDLSGLMIGGGDQPNNLQLDLSSIATDTQYDQGQSMIDAMGGTNDTGSYQIPEMDDTTYPGMDSDPTEVTDSMGGTYYDDGMDGGSLDQF